MSTAFRLAIAANIVVATIIFGVIVSLGGGFTAGVFPPLERPPMTLSEIEIRPATTPSDVTRVGTLADRLDSVPGDFRPREASPPPWIIRADGSVQFRE